MANKEKIDELLSDIRDLEKLVAEVRNEEVYSASFFTRTFDLSHKIISNLHLVETEQLEVLRRQMAEHKRLIESIPTSKPVEQSFVYSDPHETSSVVSEIEDTKINLKSEIVEQEDIMPPLIKEDKQKTKDILAEELAIEESSVVEEALNGEDCAAVGESLQEKELPVVEEMPPLPNFPELPKEDKEEKKDIPSVPAAELTVEEMFYAAKGEKPPVVVSNAVSLNDVLEKKNLADFRKALSLNDRFRFRRELFGESEAKMNKVIAELNDFESCKDSVDYLENELKWNLEDPTVVDFVKLLEKRFL